MEGYIPAIPAFSADDHFESVHWFTHAGYAGEELQHVHPFRAELIRGCRLAGLTDVRGFADGLESWPIVIGMRQTGILASPDGQVGARSLCPFVVTPVCLTHPWFAAAPWLAPR